MRVINGPFFARFRRSVGVAPHNWLIEQRIVLSKEKLRDDRLSLTDVAAECGFCDQAHFTRYFTRIVGVTKPAKPPPLAGRKPAVLRLRE